jgi:hypothetical protein
MPVPTPLLYAPLLKAILANHIDAVPCRSYDQDANGMDTVSIRFRSHMQCRIYSSCIIPCSRSPRCCRRVRQVIPAGASHDNVLTTSTTAWICNSHELWGSSLNGPATRPCLVCGGQRPPPYTLLFCRNTPRDCTEAKVVQDTTDRLAIIGVGGPLLFSTTPASLACKSLIISSFLSL